MTAEWANNKKGGKFKGSYGISPTLLQGAYFIQCFNGDV